MLPLSPIHFRSPAPHQSVLIPRIVLQVCVQAGAFFAVRVDPGAGNARVARTGLRGGTGMRCSSGCSIAAELYPCGPLCSLCTCLHACLLSAHKSAHMSHHPVRVAVHRSARMCAHMSVHTSVHVRQHLPTHVSTHTSVRKQHGPVVC